MTAFQVEQLVSRIKFGPSLEHWRPRLFVEGFSFDNTTATTTGFIRDDRFGTHVDVGIVFDVRDRTNGTKSQIRSTVKIRTLDPPESIVFQIFSAIEDLARHEVAEGFELDGRLFRDPHGGGNS